MPTLDETIEKDNFSREDIIQLLSPRNKVEELSLFKKAYEVKTYHVGTSVYLRGLIEISNICEKDCYYCGIRRGNPLVNRYLMNTEEILSAAKRASERGYGSIVLQAGEVTGERHFRFIEEIIRKIKSISSPGLGITLSLGEQDEAVYRRWFHAGAHRYLLRIETSDKELYKSLHPAYHSYDRRLECLHRLKEIGYQLGTGVMIGLPRQTVDHLARDILFFREIDADMIGMGPYIPHRETPLAKAQDPEGDSLDMALRMIAATRVVLKDVNIASTTALQVIDDSGRERGLMAGANVIMPNVTDARYRKDYQLYDKKPCKDETSNLCGNYLEARIKSIGESIGYNKWGDSPHFIRKK